MEKGICLCTLIPVRHQPAESSEMVSQVLFGETFRVLEQQRKWSLIEADYDNYTGWIDSKLIAPIPETEAHMYTAESAVVVEYPMVTCTGKDMAGSLVLLAGSSIYNVKSNHFQVLHTLFKLSSAFRDTDITGAASKMVISALSLLNTPYLWGGRSSFGIDCSGLVQTACKIAGIKMPRDASQQVAVGKTVNFMDEAEAGDIAFFENEEGNIVHTGIIMPEHKIIHSSGFVRIDSIDHQGIFNVARNDYSHNLRTIKRIV